MKTKNSILKPMISVVIPMYNSEKTITSTISSVLKQNFVNWELIVINDGSTDSSLDIVQNIKDPRVFIYSQENAGVAAARNYGVQKARAEIIAFLDSDSFMDAIKNAISLGGDADTMACIAGGIAEAWYKKIPGKVVTAVREKLTPDLRVIMDRFNETYGCEF